jgi:DNA-binding CsgD family transcriptional regulator
MTPPPVLSPRETQVMKLLAHGCLYKEIAGTLKISLPTVNTYTRRIYQKLRVRSRSQAVAKCLSLSATAGDSAARGR